MGECSVVFTFSVLVLVVARFTAVSNILFAAVC